MTKMAEQKTGKKKKGHQTAKQRAEQSRIARKKNAKRLRKQLAKQESHKVKTLPERVLFCCAEKTKSRKCLKFLERYDLLDKKSKCWKHLNDTPLHQACKEGNYDSVRSLYNEYNLFINERNSDGKTPLALAIKSGMPMVVRYIAKRSNLRLLDESKRGSYVDRAMKHPFRNLIVAELVAVGASTNGSPWYPGQAPLEIAVRNQYADVCEELLKGDCHLARVIRQPNFPRCANISEYAIRHRAEKCFNLLLQWGCDIYDTSTMMNLLRMSLQNKCPKTAATLISINPRLLETQWCRQPEFFALFENCFDPNIPYLSVNSYFWWAGKPNPLVEFLREKSRKIQTKYQPFTLQALCRVPLLKMLSRVARKQHVKVNDLFKEHALKGFKRDFAIPSFQRVESYYTYDTKELIKTNEGDENEDEDE